MPAALPATFFIEYHIEDQTHDYDHQTNDLGLFEWADHEAVCAEGFHQEALA